MAVGRFRRKGLLLAIIGLLFAVAVTDFFTTICKVCPTARLAVTSLVEHDRTPEARLSGQVPA